MFDYTVDEKEDILDIARRLGWKVSPVEFNEASSEDQWVVSNNVTNYVAGFYSEQAAWDYVGYRLGIMPYVNMETSPHNFRNNILTEMLSYKHPNISKEEYAKESINFYLWTEKDSNAFEFSQQTHTMTLVIGYKSKLNDDKISHELFRREANKDGIDLHVAKLECLFEIYKDFVAWKKRQER